MFFTPRDLVKLLNNELTGLELIFGNVSVEELLALGDALADNTSLLRLKLNYLIINQAVMHALKDGLYKNRTLQSLDLQRNGLIDGEAAILFSSLAVNRGLISLDVSYNGLTDESVFILARALKVNNSLIYLNLSSNNITNEGAIALINALVKNNRLEGIDLSFNNKIDLMYLSIIDRLLKVNQQNNLNAQLFVWTTMTFVASRRLPFDLLKMVLMHLAIILNLGRSEEEIELMLKLVRDNVNGMPKDKKGRELKSWWKNEINGKIIFKQRSKMNFFSVVSQPIISQRAPEPRPIHPGEEQKAGAPSLCPRCILM